MNIPVNFEIAKLLKEKGFDKYCHSGYTEKGDVYLHQGGQEPVKNGHSYYEGRDYNGGEFYCSAPTIAEVIIWLYEKHGIWITSEPYVKQESEIVTFIYKIFKRGYVDTISRAYLGFNSPKEAYEAAINYTLKKSVMKDLKEYLKSEGYFNFREVPGRGLCALSRFLFTTGLVVGLEESGYRGRYCYQTQEEAEIALKYWDGQGDPPGNWLKYKGEGGERENSGK